MSKWEKGRKGLAAALLAVLAAANLLLWPRVETAKLLIVDVVALSLLCLLFFARRWKGGAKTLVTLAFLCALSVVLSRILAVNTHTIRISLGSVPILLAGLLYGPFAGALVGFGADLIGSLCLSSFGYMPLLAISPVLVGGLPGLLRPVLMKRGVTPVRLGVVVYVTEIIAPICWTTYCLHLLYGTELGALLAARVPLFLVMSLVETAVIWLLIRSGIFRAEGLVPARPAGESAPGGAASSGTAESEEKRS